jgi:NTP pyrophosphatase (non-canonical NTP hydrolase)
MEKNREVLLIAQEECAEVIQAISKCFRFGLDNIKPGKPKTNREHLEEEIGDLMAMIYMCYDLKIIDPVKVREAQENKIEKLKQWSTLFDE